MPRNSPKILVTGASGFIGQHVLARLLSENCEIHALSRCPRRTSRDGVRWWTADLTDTDQTREIVKTVAPDKIIHLASRVSGNRSADSVLPSLQNNLLSAVHLMLAAIELGNTRVILAGSMEESAPGHESQIPISPYAAAKWAANGYARMFRSLYGLDVTTVRIAMVYGPGQMDHTKLVPYVITNLLSGNAPELGSGTRCVDWVYVEDVAAGLVRACLAEPHAPEDLNLGSGKTVSIRDVVEKLVAIGNPSIVPHFAEQRDRTLEQNWFADTSAAEKLLGWKTETSLDSGLAKTVKWYRENLPFVKTG